MHGCKHLQGNTALRGRFCGVCVGWLQPLLAVSDLHEAKPLLLLQVLGTATLKNPAPGVNVTLSGTIPDENSGKVCALPSLAMLCPANPALLCTAARTCCSSDLGVPPALHLSAAMLCPFAHPGA